MKQQIIKKASDDYADNLVLPEWDRKEIHGIDFRKGAEWAMNNQWISVEEDLPPYDKIVIAMDYAPELDWEDQTIFFGHRSEKQDVVTDENKFCVYPPTIIKVSHWAEIPSFKKGGEL